MNLGCTESEYIKKRLDCFSNGVNIYRRIWRKYHRIRNVAKTLVLIFPEKNNSYENTINEIIEHYVKTWKKKRIILVGKEEFSKEFLGNSRVKGVELISERDMNSLLDCFSIFVFVPNVVIVSPDYPVGRRGSNLLSCKRIEANDIIKTGLFNTDKNSWEIGVKEYLKGLIRGIFINSTKAFLFWLPSEFIARVYYKIFLRKGHDTYIKLTELYKDSYLFPAPYVGTGDVYLAAMMLERYAELKQINKYIVPVIGKSNVKICGLFNLSAVSLLKKEMNNFIKYLSFVGFENAECEILHHDPPCLSTGVMDRMRNLKGLDFFSMYQYGVFKSANREIVSLPEFNRNSDSIEKLFVENNLIPAKTVLLAPYSYTLPKLNNGFWENLADKLKEKGYCLCTNSSKKSEKAIKGSVPVFIPYNILVPFLEKAGSIIAIRSGLCEVVSSANCKKVILYKNGFSWNGKDNIDYFSLKKMGLCNDAIEITYDKNTDYKILTEKILKQF